MRGLAVVRGLLGAAGGCALGMGAFLLFAPTAEPDVLAGLWLGPGVREPLGVLGWLLGSALVHDVVIAPLVLGLGLLPLAVGRRRGAVRGAFLAAGALVLVALPPLFAPRPPRNPSVLPLDYPRGLLLALAATAVGGALVWAVRVLRGRRGRRPAARG
ncbi:hypothetical protein ACQYWQ_01980 [Streptomyces sp. P6-2-1]|uniref:hypothetical protein n=1 Tax=unclassified Streptomyces TaxID=2593676 RepID=UPI003D3611EB